MLWGVEVLTMHVLVTGATGFIGRPLLARLAADGHTVSAVARNPARSANLPGRPTVHAWPGYESPFPVAALEGVDAVVNLAGEPVNGRFTDAHKRRVYDSRVIGTQRLVEAMVESGQARKLVSGSAIGYYGERGDEALTEDSAAGSGFLADVCRAWEAEARRAEAHGIAVTRTRIGIVLGPHGGALKAMLPAFKLGLGGPLGGGRGWMSWIHLDDVVGLLAHALGQDRAPVYNLVAPQPATNAEFTKTLGRAVRRPALFPVPRLALKAVLGEMADVVLMSDRVIPAQAQKDGYAFRYPRLDGALREILG